MRHVFEFGPFTLDVLERDLFKDGRLVSLEPRAVDVLIELVVNHGQILSKNHFHDTVWKGLAVDEKNLLGAISKIREALDDTNKTAYIETRRGRGYRFAADVKEHRDGNISPLSRPTKQPQPAANAGANPNKAPWIGPEAYTLDRAADFFGRDKEITELVDLLSPATNPEKRVVLLYSPSGAGKSSLINAGLRHAFLERNDFELLPTVRIGDSPARDLISEQNPFTYAVITSTTRNDSAEGLEKPVTLSDYLSARTNRKPNTILIIDQAEELILADQGPQIKPFFIEICDALLNDPGLRVLFAFREEYVAQFERLGVELEDFSVRYPLSKLGIEEAKLAIQGPAKSQGVEFESHGLLNLLVLALCDYTGEFVEPMQLQLVCIELWDALDPGARKISWEVLNDAIRRLPGNAVESLPADPVPYFVKSVLHRFCERAINNSNRFAHAASGIDFPVSLIDLGCSQFVRERRKRPFITRGEQWTGDLPNEIADGLVNEQLLRVENVRDERRYELTHDTLIQPILERADSINDDSLTSVFSDVVRQIAEFERAQREGIDQKSIEKKSCLLFVSNDGARLQVSETALKKSGWLLPEWIITEMVNRGVLRKESLQDQVVYQLSHWRLAQVLNRYRSTLMAVDQIFRTRRLLATYLEQCLAPGAPKDLWFTEADQLLKEIDEGFEIADLSEAEAKFVLHSNLASEHPRERLMVHVAEAYEDLAAEVLREALQYPNELVRGNAVAALKAIAIDDRENLLLNLALNDADESIRRLAANVLARLGGFSVWQRLFGLLQQTPMNAGAIKVVAWMYDAMSSDHLNDFDNQIKQLKRTTRIKIRLTLTRFRLLRDGNSMLIAWIGALASTILFTVTTRTILASFNLTITQLAKFGLFEGIFNGFAGAITWSVFIGGALLLWLYLVEGRQPWSGRATPWIGGLAGLVGGIVNTVALVNVYLPSSLAEMRWITTAASPLMETVTMTRLAYAMPLYGCLVGVGVGVAARRLLPWSATVENPVRQSDDSPRFRIFANTTVQVCKYCWVIFLPTASVAIIMRSILPTHVFGAVGYPKLFGDAVSISIGGVGLAIGILYGQIILRTKPYKVAG
ncbi:MAG TPA: winged helix-turn-helix domain-containing protein [Pyrinomonadaceae bacterium]|nr:winged helix-turn-helix domain-containing protein [Pyrinomonadaceae bacterium]